MSDPVVHSTDDSRMKSSLEEKENEKNNHEVDTNGKGRCSNDERKDAKREKDGAAEGNVNVVVPNGTSNNDINNNNNNSSSKAISTTTPPSPDPLRITCLPSPTVRDGDHIVLTFGDGRHIFAQALSTPRGKNPPVKISKRPYPTANLIGLPYGTVLEVGRGKLIPLPDGEDVLPDTSSIAALAPSSSADVMARDDNNDDDGNMDETDAYDSSAPSDRAMTPPPPPPPAPAPAPAPAWPTTTPTTTQAKDNRDLVDTNTSQSITQDHIETMRRTNTDGSHIVSTLIAHSSTFHSKTIYSKHKYVRRKQMKYQTRCRIVRCTPLSICHTMFLRDARRVMNLRPDTLAQILSYGNITAGSQILIFDTIMGVVVGSVASRMGGYGRIVSLFVGQQPSCVDVLARFNLTFAEGQSIKWLHAGEVFTSSDDDDDDYSVLLLSSKNHKKKKKKTNDGTNNINHNGEKEKVEKSFKEVKGEEDDKVQLTMEETTKEEEEKDKHNNIDSAAAHDDNDNDDKEEEEEKVDPELTERESLQWPCPLLPHTRIYLQSLTHEEKIDFLARRAGRFARKLTRPTMKESRSYLHQRPCDSLIIATKYDPTSTLLQLLPHLAPSCPFVVFHEYLEPLAHTFRTVQKHNGLAINLRLMDTWMREYQILDQRTHPNMNMSQSGGYILMGIKLCPHTGSNELDDDVVKELRARVGGRRGRKPKRDEGAGGGGSEGKRKKKKRGKVAPNVGKVGNEEKRTRS